MRRYWLDADVFIQAKNGLYSFDIARPFWSFLDEEVEKGSLCSSTMIYAELLEREDKNDKLTVWAKNRRTSGMFIEPKAKEVQEVYGQIADHCVQKYAKRPAKISEFLRGGDGWIIAQAKCDRGVVVSHESRVDQSSLTPKIPNVCTAFGVTCIGLVEMLKALNFRFAK